jgi:hypothetical protein
MHELDCKTSVLVAEMMTKHAQISLTGGDSPGIYTDTETLYLRDAHPSHKAQRRTP